jgi:hypothetical protein
MRQSPGTITGLMPIQMAPPAPLNESCPSLGVVPVEVNFIGVLRAPHQQTEMVPFL